LLILPVTGRHQATTVQDIQEFSFKGYDQQPPGFSKPGFLFCAHRATGHGEGYEWGEGFQGVGERRSPTPAPPFTEKLTCQFGL